MHWLTNVWFGYFWPSLQGNGPEALVQTVAYGAIAYAVVPPFRKWVNGHFHRLGVKQDEHHAERLTQAEAHHAEALALAAKHHAEQLKAINGGLKPAEAPAKKRG